MTKSKGHDWLQLVGTFGVIVGLVFVALQLRQEQDIALGDGMMDASQRQYLIADVIGQAPELWVRGRSGDQLSEAEMAHFEQLAESWSLLYFGNWFRSNQIGSRQAQADRWVREMALDLYTYPGLMHWWTARAKRRAYTIGETGGEGFGDLVDAELAALRERGGIGQ